MAKLLIAHWCVLAKLLNRLSAKRCIIERLMRNRLGILFVCALLLAGTVKPAQAQSTGKWQGVYVGASGSLSSDVATIQGSLCLVANALNAVLTLFSFVGFLMFVYASFMLMISGGNPSAFETARNTFTYAIFGFILALSSFVIIQVISFYTGLSSFMTIKFLAATTSS